MKLIILFFSLSTISCSIAQTDFEKYDAHAWQAMLQFKDKDYENSLKNFEMAFETIADENVSDYF